MKQTALMAVWVVCCLQMKVGRCAAADQPYVSQLTSDYLNGNFDAVLTSLKTHEKEIQAMPAAQRGDITTITTAVYESRQSWWNDCRAGKKMAFHPTVWGRRLDADYQPTNTGVRFNDVGGNIRFDIGWDPVDVGSTTQAEHGFTKGELAELGIWMGLGSADGWAMIPIPAMTDSSEENRNNLVRFTDFRGCVTGAYYGTPRSRRWALFLCLNIYLPKYGKTNIQTSRIAVGAMLLHEVLSNPEKYPSIKLPASLPDERAEETLAGEIKQSFEKHALTLAEDQSIREMLKRFATANNSNAFKSATVTMPDKLSAAFDPEKDKPMSLKRNTWIRAHLPKP